MTHASSSSSPSTSSGPTQTDHWDVIVVGAGPAGLSAALILTRGRRRVLVLDHGVPRNRYTAHMHGVLGHEGLDPAELRTRGRAEVEAHGGIFEHAEVASLRQVGVAQVQVETVDGRVLTARAAVIATGLRDELQNIPGLRAAWGRGVYACPFCDGYEVRERPLAVLAMGPGTALKAQLLRQWSSDLVLLVNGAEQLEAEDRRLLEARGVRVEESGVDEVLTGADGMLTGVRLATGQELELAAIFVNPKTVPLTDFYSRQDDDARVWVVGNAANPGANVPISIGEGAAAGGQVSFALLQEDIASAARPATAEPRVATSRTAS